MVSDRYPILVKRLTGEQALIVACQACSWEDTIGVEDIRNERNYACPRCLGPADYKYEEADHECPNCGNLGFYGDLPFKPCCSRVCSLQWEYARELEGRT